MSRAVEFMSADEAVQCVSDGDTVATDGFTLLSVADEVFEALVSRFHATSHPRDLTLVGASGQSGNGGGFDRFAVDGFAKRVVGSHWGLQPAMSRFLGENRAEAICLPQGQISNLYRAIAARRPGILTRVGIGTFVDPALGGGRMNDAAQAAPDYVTEIDIEGERHLLYRSFPIDVGIIRVTTVDDDGNCSLEEEAVKLDQLGIAQAVKASGGTVIVQAKRRVAAGQIKPHDIAIPARFIDVVVVTTDVDRYHRQSHGFLSDQRLISAGTPTDPEEVATEDAERLAIGLRAVQDLKPGQIINIGTGIPGDAVPRAIAASPSAAGVTITVESGIHGGAPLGGVDFGAALHPEAIITHSSQFDFYDGGGLDATFLGVGELDREGNVNVSWLGSRIIGCGGFIDITQSTKRVYFCFAMGGRHPKFVERVSHLTFSGPRAISEGQEVWYISERAVFALTADGLVVHEVMPGYELDRDVLALIPFEVGVADHVRQGTPTLSSMEGGA